LVFRETGSGTYPSPAGTAARHASCIKRHDSNSYSLPSEAMSRIPDKMANASAEMQEKRKRAAEQKNLADP
jgi:hypothetical protein